MRFLSLIAAALLALVPVAAQSGEHPRADGVRVRLVTTAGTITLLLDTRHAPKTSANFLAYVDDGRLDGTAFYRAARRKSAPRSGFIQGGIGTDARRMLASVPLEPTNVTGIRHIDATVSMARNARPDSATGNFSIMVGANPGLDAHGTYRGYAAFAHVIQGMDVVRRILALPTSGGRGPMKGQMIDRPVTLVKAVRLDGTPHPTGQPKPWLLNFRRP